MESKAELEENGNVLILPSPESVALMTLLTTPILDFHQVISAPSTPLTIPTLTLICR